MVTLALQELTALGSPETVPLGMDTGICDRQQQQQGTCEFPLLVGGAGQERKTGTGICGSPCARSPQTQGDTPQSPPAITGARGTEDLFERLLDSEAL